MSLAPSPTQEHPAPHQWGWLIKMEFYLPAWCDSSHRKGASATLVDVFFLTCSRCQAQEGLSFLHPNGARAGDILLLLQQPTVMFPTPSHPHTHTPKCGQEEKVHRLWWRVLRRGIILECHYNSAKAHFWQKFIGEMPCERWLFNHPLYPTKQSATHLYSH